MNSLPLELLRIITLDLTLKDLIVYRSVSTDCLKIMKRMVSFINIRCSSKITDDCLGTYKYAKNISLKMCKQITDEGLGRFRNLFKINLKSCHKITDQGLSHFRNMNINEINLSGCCKVTDVSLSYFPNVVRLNISYLNKITDSGLLAFSGRKFDWIKCNSCNKITESGVEFLKTITKTHLRYLPCKVCRQTTDDNEDNLIYTQVNYRDGIFEDTFNRGDSNFRRKIERFNRIGHVASLKKLYNDIYQTNYLARDGLYMKDYRALLPCLKLLDYESAIERLLQHPYINRLIKEFRAHNLDILIGGSFGLHCVYRSASFKPKDLDIYVKNISYDKLCTIENIIYRVFDIKEMIVTRSPIVMTWYITYKTGGSVEIYSIQLNLMKILSWPEPFITYHSEITCIGYEVLSNNFLYLVGRFDKFLVRDFTVFSNILNQDTVASLINAADKYLSRSFNSLVYAVKKEYDYSNDMSPSEANNNKLRYATDKFLPNLMYDKYRFATNIQFSTSVLDLCHVSETFIKIKYLSIVGSTQPSKIPKKVTDFLDLRNVVIKRGLKVGHRQFLTVGVECFKCMKVISLKDWMFRGNRRSVYGYIDDKLILL